MQEKLHKANDFTDFAKQVKWSVGKRMGDGYEIHLHTEAKNGDERRVVIRIRYKDGLFTQSLCLERFYMKYQEGMPIEEIAGELEAAYYKTAYYRSLDQVKKNIFYRVVNYKKSKERLSDKPYLPFLDLAVTFHCLVQNNGSSISSFPVTESQLKLWGINAKELTEQAVINTPRLFPVKICALEEVLEEMTMGTAFTGVHSIYVITNTIGINGAGCLLYKDEIKFLADKLEANLYILPSSIHEIIAVKDSGCLCTEELAGMVKEVNRTQVADKDYLSDSVYYYSREENRIVKCDK